jgi:hypothetical protein
MRQNLTLPFVVKGGGHSYACQSVPKDGGVLIDTGRLTAISVHAGYIRAGAGALTSHVLAHARKHNRYMLHGQCGSVSVGGFFLNVGSATFMRDGWIPLRSVTGVTPQGSLVRITDNGTQVLRLAVEEILPTITLKDVYYFGTNFLTAVEVEINTLPMPCDMVIHSFYIRPQDMERLSHVNPSIECAFGVSDRRLGIECRSLNCMSVHQALRDAGFEVDVTETDYSPDSSFPIYGNTTTGWISTSSIITSPLPSTLAHFCGKALAQISYGNCASRGPTTWVDRLDFRTDHDSAVLDARAFYSGIGPSTYSDPHLPNCIASKNVSFYALRLKKSGRNATYVTNLISTLDPHQRISYWKSWRTQASDGECAAAKLWGGTEPPRSPNCIRHGITRKDIQLAHHRKTQALCPGFDYKDAVGSNRRCKDMIMQNINLAV